ncbi:galactose-3-O-sulfotransferase 2-like [Protopterus annectens]|uniref:galactose-3-O-sulfotransferase 2-like n=1 Tax=Protopterus annectens TaxID=7888 RepID=UPI001CFA7762|nr:galactose-3-O-sulfotransferase 2-like [Protopterus annectens]
MKKAQKKTVENITTKDVKIEGSMGEGDTNEMLENKEVIREEVTLQIEVIQEGKGYALLESEAEGEKKTETGEEKDNEKNQLVGDLIGKENKTWKSCQPKTHVMFLKTHKTGSSTVQNIIFRYAERENLSLALPKNRFTHLLNYPRNFSADFVKQTATGQKFDILANHMRFNFPEVLKVMHDDTFYFSILRHPIPTVKSVFMYWNTDTEIFRNSKDLNEFMKFPLSYYKLNYTKNYYAKNLMWFDFGLNHNHVDDEDYFEAAISWIESTFNLILISEYFEESMILLKEALCWSMDDVTYFVLNKRSKASTQNLTQETISRIKEWNSLDWKLYLHFNKTFWRKIKENIGLEQMNRKVQLLKQKNKELKNTCLQNSKATDPANVISNMFLPFQPNKAKIQGYNLKTDLNNITKHQCQRMILTERWYSKLIYNKQFSNLSIQYQIDNYNEDTSK